MGYEEVSSRRSIFYSLPITIGTFFREVLAVTLVLVLQQRASTYDFFNQGLVLLLIFLTFRVPYINSYTLLFEAISLGDWNIKNHVGMRKYDDISQNLIHVTVIFAAHVCGSIAAAALRVYFDVLYGSEIMFGKQPLLGPNSDLAPALTVNVDQLKLFDSFWGAGNRITRLIGMNGSISQLFPLSAQHDLGIGSTALTVWYTTEEIGYVFLLCVCYIHIWLSTGVGENKKAPLNPFSQNYWRHLFQVCLMVVLVYMSLYRAFPTAHGSLHTTIYKIQYQSWNPNVKLVDTDNGETFARIFGGFIGLFLAVGYNKMLVGTERINPDDDSGDFYYKLIWGLEPDPSHSRAKRVSGGSNDDSSSDEELAKRRNPQKWASIRRSSHSMFSSNSSKHVDGNCVDPSCSTCGLNRKPVLRIPHTLDHPK